MTVKIVVTGAHGTGKTTLCDHLSEALQERGFASSVIGGTARRVAAQGLPLGQQCTMETYYALARAHVENFLQFPGRITIYDRFIGDLLAYIRANGNAPELFEDLILTLSRMCVAGVDVVLYLPIEFPLVEDGVRDADPKYQSQVDLRLRELLNEIHAEYSVISGTLPDRLRAAIGAVESVAGLLSGQ